MFRPEGSRRKNKQVEDRKKQMTVFFLRNVKPVLIILFIAGELVLSYLDDLSEITLPLPMRWVIYLKSKLFLQICSG